jgi:hypothetical protein
VVLRDLAICYQGVKSETKRAAIVMKFRVRQRAWALFKSTMTNIVSTINLDVRKPRLLLLT